MNFTLRDFRALPPGVWQDWFLALRPEQQGEILALRRDESRKSRLCAHRLALEMLSAATGLPMEALTFCREPLGKPRLCQREGLHFNVSHSAPYALCAVDTSPVGADVEALRPLRPHLIPRICTPEEARWMGADPVRFLQIWTGKEALLKYRGTGIREDLRKIPLLREGALSPEGLTLFQETGPDYVLSIVSEK